MGCIQLASMTGCCEQTRKFKFQEIEEFIAQMCDYNLFKKDQPSWSNSLFLIP
jgi:hypothetical protein